MKNYIQILSRSRRGQKRHFQLLELMVAAFILLICLGPTLRIFTSMYQTQQGMIREQQRDHLAHVVHAKFTERLYKRQISVEIGEQEKTIILDDPEIEKILKRYSYNCTNTFGVLKFYKPKGQENPIEYLCKLVIKIKDLLPKPQAHRQFENQDPSETIYDYYVYIDTKVEPKKDADEDTMGDDDPQDDENAVTQPTSPVDAKHQIPAKAKAK